VQETTNFIGEILPKAKFFFFEIKNEVILEVFNRQI
jgi:hypothetical protein